MFFHLAQVEHSGRHFSQVPWLQEGGITADVNGKGNPVDLLRTCQRLLRVGIVALSIFLAILLYLRLRPDPNVARARELAKQMADATLSADQRRQVGRQFRDQVQKLNPAQRRDVFQDRRKAMEKRIADFFKKSRQEQIAQLDEDINRMQQFRGQGPPQGGGPMNNPGRARSSEDRDTRRRERLDQTTPEFRAQMAEYFKQLNARRQQRGFRVMGLQS